MTAGAPQRRGERWTWVLGAAFALFYFATFSARSDGIITGNDVVSYAETTATHGAVALESIPNHLGYHGLSALAYRAMILWPGASPGIEVALVAQQLVAALGGGLLVVAIARLAALAGGMLLALPLACCLGLAHGVWWAAAVGDSYVPAMAATAWVLLVALAPVSGGPPAQVAPLAAWLAAAVVLRQDAVLVVPALAVVVPWRTLVPALGAAGALALCCYAAAWLVSDDPNPFLRWLIGLGGAEHGGWGAGWTAEGSRLALRHLLVMFQAADWDVPGTGMWTLWPLLAATALAWPWPAAAARGVLACFVHLAVSFGFYAWWESGNLEYQIPMQLPVAAAFALLLAPRGGRWRRAAQCGLIAASALGAAGGAWWKAIGPYRGQAISEHSRLAIVAAAPDGIVFALDTWQYVALVRARGLVFADGFSEVKLQDLHGAAAPDMPERTEALRRWLASLVQRGRTSAVIGDQMLRPDQIGPTRADPEVLERLLSDLPHEPLRNAAGRVVAHAVGPKAR